MHPTPEIEKLLVMTGLSTIIPTFHDEKEAVSSFKN